MNSQDLETIRGFTIRTAAIMVAIRQLAALQIIAVEAVDVELVRADIKKLETEIEALVDDVSEREAVSWGRRKHRQRHEPPRRIPLSTEVDPNAKVERYGVNGRPKGQHASPPKPSGRWTQWRGNEGR